MSDEKDTAAIQRQLEQLAEDPTQFDQAKFGEMEQLFGEVNSGAFCPCGSKATFSGCCRNRWLPAKRAWTRVKKESKQDKKADAKHMQEQTGKDDIYWGGMIGISKTQGPVVAPCPGQEGFDVGMLIKVLPEVWASLLTTNIRNQVFGELNAIAAKEREGRDVTKPILN